MKKLSNTFIKIVVILSLVIVGLLLLSGIVCIVLGVLPPIHDAIREGYDPSANPNGFPDADTAVYFYLGMMVGAGATCLLFVPLCIANAVVSNKASKEPSKGRYIACIILGSMTSKFTLAGGILGLIAQAREDRNKNRVVE